MFCDSVLFLLPLFYSLATGWLLGSYRLVLCACCSLPFKTLLDLIIFAGNGCEITKCFTCIEWWKKERGRKRGRARQVELVWKEAPNGFSEGLTGKILGWNLDMLYPVNVHWLNAHQISLVQAETLINVVDMLIPRVRHLPCVHKNLVALKFDI